MPKYLFAQPWYEDDDRFLFEPAPWQVNDWQRIGWRINWEYSNDNYAGLTSNTARNPDYNPSVDDYLTTQFQFTFDKPVDVWGKSDAFRMGAMLAVTGHGGEGVAYGNFYAKWMDKTTGNQFWFQANYFDERGHVNRDSIYVDHFTNQAALASDLGHSKYHSLAPTSGKMESQAWQGMRFKGLVQTEAQFDALIEAIGSGSRNPLDYRLTAIGHAPEIAFADSPSWMMEYSDSFFFNLEG